MNHDVSKQRDQKSKPRVGLIVSSPTEPPDVAQTPDCNCPLQTTALYENFGGHADPLVWKFSAYQKALANPQQKQIICYVKHVENKSAQEVRDILWDVAAIGEISFQIIQRAQLVSIILER